MSEPAALQGHSSYYSRRQLQPKDDAVHYRTTKRMVQTAEHTDR